MKKVIETGRYDIIWTNEPVMGVVTRLAAKKARKRGTKVVYMCHGFHFFKGSGKVSWLLYYPCLLYTSSYMLNEYEVAQYLDLQNVIRRIPIGFEAKSLIGKIFIVTGTGKYFKNVNDDPETNLGIVRIAADGCTAELLWGYKDGGKFTSEFPAHMMSHMARLSVDPENRVVMHCQMCIRDSFYWFAGLCTGGGRQRCRTG